MSGPGKRRPLRTVFTVSRHLAVALALCTLPIPWHEIVGHGFVGVLCGGRVTRFQLFGLQLLPNFAWVGIQEGLGVCDHTGIGSRWCVHLTDLAGSMSTFIVAALAAYLLWRFRPRGLKFTALLSLTLWATDLLTFTLPSFGLRRYIWSGTRYSEPYEAAVSLGIPGLLFQAFVLAAFSSVALMVGLAVVPRSREKPVSACLPPRV